ncbi:MAG: hypothetical protein RIR51_752 [Bacteroidota bacterium]
MALSYSKSILTIAFLWFSFLGFSQTNKPKTSLFNATMVVGYVDGGAFINVLGPNMMVKKGEYTASIGLLPSIRLKEDKKTPKNSFATPTLGVGLTLKRKHLIVQLPMYYNPKTPTQNGKWNLGFGLGFSI